MTDISAECGSLITPQSAEQTREKTGRRLLEHFSPAKIKDRVVHHLIGDTPESREAALLGAAGGALMSLVALPIFGESLVKEVSSSIGPYTQIPVIGNELSHLLSLNELVIPQILLGIGFVDFGRDSFKRIAEGTLTPPYIPELMAKIQPIINKLSKKS